MNYLKEMNAFYDWLMYNSLPTGAIALWHALMAINNKAGWAIEFTVANIVLQGMTGLSRQGLDRARNILIQKGLIEYKKGTSNQAGKYKMTSFDSQKVGTVVDTKVDTGKVTENLECKIIGTEHDTKRTDYDTQSGHSSSTLNKLNKTKLNICSSTTTDQEEFFDNEFSELAKLYQQCIGQPNGLTAEWIENLLKDFGFEWSKNAFLIAEKQGKRTKRYVEGILQNWKRGGGMKLESDAVANSENVSKPKKTRFHTAEQRTSKYTTEELEKIAEKKRDQFFDKEEQG